MKRKEIITTPEKIIDLVCYYYDVTQEELLSDNITKRINIPRKMTAYLIDKCTNVDYEGISKLLCRHKYDTHGSKKWMYKEEINNSHIFRMAKKIQDELIPKTL